MNDSRKLWTRAGNFLASALRALLLLFLGGYRTLGTLFLGGACRFEPSCSQYAVEAATHHHPITAMGLIWRRVCRCRPGGPMGYDPVPLPQSLASKEATS